MEFWGEEVKSGQTVSVQPGTDNVVHVSQAALGEVKKDKAEHIYLYVTIDGKKLVIGTLNSDNLPQQQFDLLFDKDFEISHSWKGGSVYFFGYKSVNEIEIDEESESEEELPSVPVNSGKPVTKVEAADKASAKASASDKKKVKIAEPSDEDTSEEEEDSEDENGSDEDESDEESEETPKKAESSKKRPTDTATKTPVPDKKAKFVTPEKTDGKKGIVHVDTPHPKKKAGKTPGNKPNQTPKSGGSHACKPCNRTFGTESALDSHNKAKHSAANTDLHNIAECCSSLCWINLNACTSITDSGISVLVLKCLELHSIFACDTLFGHNCVQSLCRDISRFNCISTNMEKHTNSCAYNLQILHIGGCKDIHETSLLELISQTHCLRSLCLRETRLVENSLYNFSGSSLEMLDVSDTKVSCHAVGHVVLRNPHLRCLIARGCRHLLQEETNNLENSPVLSYNSLSLCYELGKSCNLEEIALGWGFSFFSLEALRPAIKKLRTFIVGLGGSLGEDGLKLVPTLCPLLETLILYFQVISDSAVRTILETLKNLEVLALCYCFGEISMLSFQFRAPRLGKLKLERVTTQMTNGDLLTLTQNCMNLTELSLVGCRLLNSESQYTISNGWPGLICLHLEDCGDVTAMDVTSLMNCQALEDLLLRHNGLGIDRDFIIRASSRMPLLRKIALDVCDAKDGDFDLPDFPDRRCLSIVKIARCSLKRRTMESRKSGSCTAPVHVETLILSWDSKKLSRTVVKERL